MARKRATLTDLLNDLTFRKLYDKYKLLAISVFEWENLPDGIEAKHIERTLFSDGKAIFFRDNSMSYMCLRADDTGKVNVYNEPIKYLAVGNGYTKEYDVDDCVIIENNMLRLNTSDFLLFYVNKLTEAERTMDVNTKRCKTPYVFACDEKDVLSVKQLFQTIDGNSPLILADKKLNLETLAFFKTEAKFLGNEIMDYKKSVENELLTFLGINNLAVDKKERVNTDEATSNNEITETFGDLQLKARQQACKLINKKYGLKISVKRKESAQNNVQRVEHKQTDA